MTTSVQAGHTTRLTGLTLRLARVGWLTLSALIVAFWVIDLWFLYQDFQTPCRAPTCHNQGSLLPPVALAELQAHGLSVHFYAAYNVGLYVLFFLVFAGVGALIFWRKPDEPLALFFSFDLLLWGGAFPDPAAAMYAALPAFYALVEALSVFSSVFFYLFFFFFPNGRFVPPWTRWAVLVFALWMLFDTLFPNRALAVFLQPIHDLILVGFLVIGIAAQIYRYYRVSSPVERQQTKWVLFGVVVGLGGIIPVVLYFFWFNPQAQTSVLSRLLFYPLAYLGFMAIPLSIGTAILRSRLYDIDIVIRRTLVYTALTATLGLIYFGCVVIFQQLFGGWLGMSTQPAIIASTLALALLFTPLRRRIQLAIDRHFYRRKYDAEQVLATFNASMRDETDLDKLTAALIAVAQETFQPQQISLWLKPVSPAPRAYGVRERQTGPEGER